MKCQTSIYSVNLSYKYFASSLLKITGLDNVMPVIQYLFLWNLYFQKKSHLTINSLPLTHIYCQRYRDNHCVSFHMINKTFWVTFRETIIYEYKTNMTWITRPKHVWNLPIHINLKIHKVVLFGLNIAKYLNSA